MHGEKRGAENRGRSEEEKNSLTDFRGRERRERQQTLEPDALEDEVVSTILDSGLADSRYERSAQTEERERVRGSAKRAGPRREKGKQAASNHFFSFLPLRRCVVVPPTIADTPRKQDSRPQLEVVRL